VPCPESGGEDPGKDFLKPTSSVRLVLPYSLLYSRDELIVCSDTLEQIDVSHQLIAKHSDVRSCFFLLIYA
jgi:hypothetical protein